MEQMSPQLAKLKQQYDSRNTRKIKRMKVKKSLIIEALRRHIQQIPADGQIMKISDIDLNMVELELHSASYPSVNEHAQPPEITPTVTTFKDRTNDVLALLDDLLNPENYGHLISKDPALYARVADIRNYVRAIG